VFVDVRFAVSQPFVKPIGYVTHDYGYLALSNALIMSQCELKQILDYVYVAL